MPHFEAARLRSLPARNANRRRCHSVASSVPLHDCPSVGSHCEAHHRRSTPSTRLRRKSECHALGNRTVPATRSIASAYRVPGASLLPMECLSVPADLRTVATLHLRCAVASPTATHDCNPSPQQRSPTRHATCPPPRARLQPFCSTSATVNAFVRASLRRFPPLQFHSPSSAATRLWPLRKASSDRISILVNSPMPLARLHTTGNLSAQGPKPRAQCRIMPNAASYS